MTRLRDCPSDLVNTKLTQTELIMLRFLLDFKREFSYPRVYRLWETIWAAGNDRLFAMRVRGQSLLCIWSGAISSPQFHLFIALSLVETYRDIIIDRLVLLIHTILTVSLFFRNMDFTDIIKFFNEMAEHHDEEEILHTARDMVNQMKSIVMDT